MAAAVETRTIDMPPGPISGPAAWKGSDMARCPEKWTFTLSPEELQEVDYAVQRVRRSGLGLNEITPGSFPLPQLGTRLTGCSSTN